MKLTSTSCVHFCYRRNTFENKNVVFVCSTLPKKIMDDGQVWSRKLFLKDAKPAASERRKAIWTSDVLIINNLLLCICIILLIEKIAHYTLYTLWCINKDISVIYCVKYQSSLHFRNEIDIFLMYLYSILDFATIFQMNFL